MHITGFNYAKYTERRIGGVKNIYRFIQYMKGGISYAITMVSRKTLVAFQILNQGTICVECALFTGDAFCPQGCRGTLLLWKP
jgi:hypothetical protein